MNIMFHFNKGIFIWVAPRPRRWLLIGIHKHGIIYHWHCCTRDRPDKGEIKDIIDMIVRHAKGFKIRIAKQKGNK